VIGRRKVCLFVAAAAAAADSTGTGVDIVGIEAAVAAAFHVASVVPVEVAVGFADGCAVAGNVVCNEMAVFELVETKMMDDSSSSRFSAAVAIKHSKTPMDRRLAYLHSSAAAAPAPPMLSCCSDFVAAADS